MKNNQEHIRVPGRITGLRLSLAFFAACCLLSASGICQAQSHAAANAIVGTDSLVVYSGMSASATVVRSLKKGDQVVWDFEIRNTTGRWCGVRLPAQTTRLGYVQCEGLEVQQPVIEQPQPADRRAWKHPGADLPITPPRAPAATEYDEVARGVVRQGSVDAANLARLDTAARSGSPAAMARAALAHLAVGNFELSRNDAGRAIEHYRAALGFSAKQPDLLLDSLLSLADGHLWRSEYSAALEHLKRARRMAPGSAEVAQLFGWAYYGLNRVDQAIEEWKTAQRIKPSPEVARALESAERDKRAESEFREEQASHFLLRYHGGATPQLAAEILRTLEEHYLSVRSELRFTPAEPIGVILYTQQAYFDVTRAPRWADALNDGRIRLAVQGLTSVSDQFSRVLKHELTHSFVGEMTVRHCPEWLNEGLAEWMTGQRTARDAQSLIAAYDRGAFGSLRALESSWAEQPVPAVRLAYAWSLAVVESIIADSGMEGIRRLLDQLAAEPSVEVALRGALRTSYADLEQQTASYLRRTYPQ